MAKYRNVSPLGALELPMLGGVIEHGEEFEVPDEQAVYLDGQAENFERIYSEAELKAQEREAEKAAAAAAKAAKAEASHSPDVATDKGADQ